MLQGHRGRIGRSFRHWSLLPALLSLSLSSALGSGASAEGRFGPAREPGAEPRVSVTTGRVPGVPTRATESERRKLEAARAAVERARAAGTLHRARAKRAEVSPLRSDWEIHKRALMRAQRPKPVADDPAAGVGPLPSVQKQGPAGLTPAEQAKLRAPQRPSKDREPNEGGR